MKKCVIQIADEVNCKIQNLELSERRTLMKMFSFDVPGARYLPSVRLGRWDGKVSFFSLAGSTYINLLEEIIPVLDGAGYQIEIDDRRTYSRSFTFDSVKEDTYSNTMWPKGHPVEGAPMMLRDYQVEIINNFLANPQCLQEIATGAGKCLAGATLICVSIDENTAFGKFMINKLQQGQENEVTRNSTEI